MVKSLWVYWWIAHSHRPKWLISLKEWHWISTRKSCISTIPANRGRIHCPCYFLTKTVQNGRPTSQWQATHIVNLLLIRKKSTLRPFLVKRLQDLRQAPLRTNNHMWAKRDSAYELKRTHVTAPIYPLAAMIYHDLPLAGATLNHGEMGIASWSTNHEPTSSFYTE